ncbi:hypothetical protein [Shewanella waksmanii]|uniref:hypothetical protein n=1 Tax=Shewanella waksmanii TaxID=213783 RepID=UPI0037365F9F
MSSLRKVKAALTLAKLMTVLVTSIISFQASAEEVEVSSEEQPEPMFCLILPKCEGHS